MTADGNARKIYDLTGPKGIAYTEVSQLFTYITGKTITSTHISVERLRHTLMGYGKPEVEASATAELLGLMATGTAGYTSPDVERSLGYSPRDFAQFLSDYGTAFSSVPSALKAGRRAFPPTARRLDLRRDMSNARWSLCNARSQRRPTRAI